MKYYIIDKETGEVVREIKQGDSIKITRRESKEFLKENVKLNDKESFIKFYTNILDDLVSEKLTSAEFNIVLICLKNLNYSSGAVAFKNNGNFLTPQDFVKRTKLSERAVKYAIKNLVDKKILHKGRTGREYQLFVNPYIFMKGVYVNKTLKDMFKNSKWAKTKKNMSSNIEKEE